MLSYEQGLKLITETLSFGTIEDLTPDEILLILQSADQLYHNHAQSFLTDEQYDSFFLYCSRIIPNHAYFTGIGSAVRGGKIKLPFPMGSLTQAYDGDIVTWINKYKLHNEKFVMSDKLDGTSALLIYGQDGNLQIAYSRGDGLEGADITRHISKIHNVPAHVEGERVVRAEVIISEPNFLLLQKLIKTRAGAEYKNARNMTAGLMNAKENNPIVYDYLEVIAYELIVPKNHGRVEQSLKLSTDGFNVAPWVASLGHLIDDSYLTSLLNQRRKESDYALDGIVVDVDDYASRSALFKDTDSLNPEYARKFKIADANNVAIATVVKVEWNVSKDGYLKPRVQILPVELVGVTVQYATGFNAKFIKENSIGPGATIKVTRSGDVVPFILEVITPANQPDMPDVEATWTATRVDLIVADVATNKTVLFETLVDFFNSIDAPHLKEGNLQLMFDAGFETPESIIELTQQDLTSLLGSALNGKKVFNGLREKLTNIPLYKLMGAHASFGRGIGVRKMKKLYEAFDGDMTRCQSITEILNVDGFDQKTGLKVVNGYPDFIKFYESIARYVVLETYAPKAQGKLSGQTFVFTGFRSTEYEKRIELLGGKMSTSVSKNTSYLVADDPSSTSGKTEKARVAGVNIISVKQLVAILES